MDNLIYPRLCPGCNHRLSVDDQICPSCDINLSDYKKLCPVCEVEIPAGMQYCTSCKETLPETKRGSLFLNIKAYLWGALAGGIALGILKIIEHFLNFSDRTVEMAVFGLVAISFWNTKKSQYFGTINPDDAEQTEVLESEVLGDNDNITNNDSYIIADDSEK